MNDQFRGALPSTQIRLEQEDLWDGSSPEKCQVLQRTRVVEPGYFIANLHPLFQGHSEDMEQTMGG